MTRKQPPSVLHVVESLDGGAVENWLVRMHTHAASRGLATDWTFYCTLQHEGRLDETARAQGAKVLHTPVPLDDKLGFARAFRRSLAQGNYDVLHAHHDMVSALYLTASVGLPLQRRIVHIHNADENVLTPSLWRQSLYRPAARRTCLALGDRIVGISDHTLDTFLAGRPRRSGRDLVHYYGVDPAPFLTPAPDRKAFRTQLGLEPDAIVLLFAGRIVPEKNPVFVIEVLAALRQHDPRIVAVFAGSGSLEDDVRRRSEELAVSDAVRFLGWRDDLPDIMRCADCFVLPRPESPMEGFGLAVVEAQLAGLRLLVSRGIADDPLLPGATVRRPPLDVEAWALAARALLSETAPEGEDVLARLAASPMDMDRALTGLMDLHT